MCLQTPEKNDLNHSYHYHWNSCVGYVCLLIVRSHLLNKDPLIFFAIFMSTSMSTCTSISSSMSIRSDALQWDLTMRLFILLSSQLYLKLIIFRGFTAIAVDSGQGKQMNKNYECMKMSICIARRSVRMLRLADFSLNYPLQFQLWLVRKRQVWNWMPPE